MLYLLILTDPELSYDGYTEDFPIGIFETEKQAEETACYYLAHVKGFCDFPCTYRIIEKEIVGYSDNMTDCVWIVQGWNVNEHLDETDIIESACFLTEAQANTELQVMKSSYQRTEWAVNCWQIGALEWREGFVRMVGGQPVN